jgi:tRNA(fMet)-specific endonuclease VapC
MPPGQAVVDTSAVLLHFRGERAYTDALAGLATIFLPSIALGELVFGACHSADSVKSLRLLKIFVAGTTVLSICGETAEYYGRIRHDLAAAGRPIPDNDIWIAALCMRHALPLLARDAHFGQVKGLRLVTY